jgi:4'-phosphopantetheinyl transferase
MVEIFAIKLAGSKQFENQKTDLLSFLPKVSQDVVLKHKTIEGAQRTLLGDMLARQILSQRIAIPAKEINYKKTIKGKPYLQNGPLYFNLSHSGEWVVLAIAEKEVGVDIEVVREVNYRVAERFFSKEENRLLAEQSGREKLNLFFEFWTLKESYLKLLGTGLTKSLGSFTIVKDKKSAFLRENAQNTIEPVHFRQYNLANNYKLAACSFLKEFDKKPQIVTIEELMYES